MHKEGLLVLQFTRLFVIESNDGFFIFFWCICSLETNKKLRNQVLTKPFLEVY